MQIVLINSLLILPFTYFQFGRLFNRINIDFTLEKKNEYYLSKYLPLLGSLLQKS